jgi:hypothetical protein
MTAARCASPIIGDRDIFRAARITASAAFRRRTPNRSRHAQTTGLLLPERRMISAMPWPATRGICFCNT